MLANDFETPRRPRPPAKLRRSASLVKTATTPPPSYASAFPSSTEEEPQPDTFLGSPMLATFKKVGWDNDIENRGQLSPAVEEDLDWVNEKSREELSELLVKADDLIKERENELGFASATCKSLFEDNMVLKSKHQALLARLPSSVSQPIYSPTSSSVSLSQTRPFYSLSRSASDTFASPLPGPFKRHTRKISVTTADFSLLADQNAELLEKLEKLESESQSSDQSGRRLLKRLEKEISTLREELEKTQAKSEELEERTKAGFRWGAEEAWRRKKEREAKFKAMRNAGQDYEQDNDEVQVKNFAPEGSLFGGPSSTYSLFPDRHEGDTSLPQSGGPVQPVTQPEYALISQLLVKIKELEDTNVRIIEQQTETTNQLQAVQRETEHITKVYECLGEQNLIELESDMAALDGKDMIQFRSLKQKLGAPDPETVPSGNGNSTKSPFNTSTVTRSRMSVVGLFDTNNTLDPKHGSHEAFNPPVLLASRTNQHPTWSVGSSVPVSPALSSLSLSTPQSLTHNDMSPLDRARRTLENELGNEFDDAWGLNASNHHLRASSLYDLTQISATSSPSPSPSHMIRSHTSCGSDSEQTPGPRIPASAGNSILRLSVEPPTPEKAGEVNGGFIGRQSTRYQRMSETVRSRTTRWIDGRFKDTLTGDPQVHVGDDHHNQDILTPTTPLPQRLANALDAAVETFTAQYVSSDNAEGLRDAAKPKSSSREFKSVGVERPPTRDREKNRLGAILLEIWLWLQFGIIVLVFLWAMAKRGPKSVLAGSTQRSATSTQG